MDYLNKILMKTTESSCRSALDSEVYKRAMIPGGKRLLAAALARLQVVSTIADFLGLFICPGR